MKFTKTVCIPFAILIIAQLFFSCSKNTRSDVLGVLKTEGFDSWMVTDIPNPKVSWTPKDYIDQKKVIGYQVKATYTEPNNANVTHEIKDIAIVNGPYTFLDVSKLPSRTKVSWKVKPIFQNQVFGEWSSPFEFQVGLKNHTDWKGEWIGLNANDRKKAAVWLRKSFTLDKEIQQAILYSCGLGLHEPWLNGKIIGNEVLQPAQTDYERRSFYIANDVTNEVKKGENTLGVWLGDGFYNQDKVWGPRGLSYGQPKLIAQLEVTFTDGTTDIITTDQTWKAKPSAITASNVYAGENYNANLYNPLWASHTENLSDWLPVNILKPAGGQLIAQELPPCRILDTVSTKNIYQLPNGEHVFDFGQNLVGWATLKVNATPNTLITIRFAEDKKSNGELNFKTSGVSATKVIQTDHYICKGNGEEIWKPKFTNHGFRYAEVNISNGTLKNNAPTKDMLTGKVIHTDMSITGTFSSSNETLNKAFNMAYWTQIGSVLGVPVDCPIRERCGWTGDAHLTVPYTMYHFDAATMWNKYVNDIKTASERTGKTLHFGENFMDRSMKVKPAGLPTMIVPGKRTSGAASPDWGSAIVFIPWDLYLFTGDIRPLENNYSSIKQWTEHLISLSENDVINIGLGDWCKPILENPNNLRPPLFYGEMVPMISTACYYRCARITADAAKLLGKQDDFNYYDALANKIRKTFTKTFYSDDSIYKPDQTVNAIAIDWNVLAPELHSKIAQKLNQQVIDADYHFMAGVFGMPSLWSVLGEFGYYKTISKMLANKTSPSIQNLIDKGGTTFWEVFPLDSQNMDDYDRSMSHPFQGAFVSWFYNGLAGIKPDTNEPGFKLIHLAPQIIDNLDWVNCTYNSPMGKIESSWKKENNQMIWTVEIPPGAKAQLKIPGTIVKIERKNTATPVSIEQGKTILNSGRYKIVVEL
jgi:alpha-L-rhamnosidase